MQNIVLQMNVYIAAADVMISAAEYEIQEDILEKCNRYATDL